jgi:hypothetical protein
MLTLQYAMQQRVAVDIDQANIKPDVERSVTPAASGRVQMLFSGLPPVLPFLQNGSLRAIAVADAARARLKSGPGIEIAVWTAIGEPHVH